MIIMSVDVGTARTGVALSDKDEGFAFPKGVITEYNRERLIERLAQKAKELGAEMIVVGLPRNMDGSEGFKAKECTEAAEALNFTDTRGKKRKQVVDAVAATIILEDFLRFRNR